MVNLPAILRVVLPERADFQLILPDVGSTLEKQLASESQYLCVRSTASPPKFIFTVFKMKAFFSPTLIPCILTEIAGRGLSCQSMK